MAAQNDSPWRQRSSSCAVTWSSKGSQVFWTEFKYQR